MATSRRQFLKLVGAAGAAGVASTQEVRATSGTGVSHDAWGMLSDLTLCIGCRKCEFACKEANHLPNQPLDAFEDMSVFDQHRRTAADNLTVVNRYEGPGPDAAPVYVKSQCMHCNEPACASACPVAAIRKTAEGPVVYDASRCMGCRYCVMACPFSMPSYTYDNAYAPVVRKCVMCYQTVNREGGVPACARICPVEAVTFGKRKDLLALAREKIRSHPDRYVNHIYGEHEVGGTSWLYLAPKSFEELGFRMDLDSKAYPEHTAGFLSIVPLVVSMWPIVLLGLYAVTGHRKKSEESPPAPDSEAPTPESVDRKRQPPKPAKGA